MRLDENQLHFMKQFSISSNNIKSIIKIVQVWNYNDQELLDMSKNQGNQINVIQLRGGGCCGLKKVHSISNQKYQLLEENFASNLEMYTNIIVEKSLSFQDKMNQNEVLTAFQWFQNNKIQFQTLCNEESSNLANYDLIEKITGLLMQQLPTYVKLSGYLFYLLLQICNDLFRIIFSYQLNNEDRFMQDDLKKKFLEYIQEIESQIQVETVNIWINGIEFELQMIKTCVSHCRTNSEKGKELIISIMSGLISSISQLKPSDELIDSLIEGGKYLLLNFYDKKIQNPLQIYEIYYFFQQLKWSILNQLKLGFSIENVINQIKDGYLKYIKFSKDWMIHYCWVDLISELMCYRPIIHKNQLQQIQQSEISDQDKWNQLIVSNQVVQLPYNKFAGKLKIFANQNLIFKQFSSLKLFQEYLIEGQDDIQLLPNYINFNFNSQKEQQLNNGDLLIQLLTNQSNLELLRSLNKQLQSLKDRLLSNFEIVKQQLNKYNSQLKTSKPIEIKIISQDVKFLMNEIKQSSMLLLLLMNEINFLINKELQINSIFLVLSQNQHNKQEEKPNILKQQTIQLIQEVENKYQLEFLDYLNQASQFWIQISQYTIISHSGLIEKNLELDKVLSLEPQLNQNIQKLAHINNYIKNFLLQLPQIKRNFLKTLDQQELKVLMNEKISQRNLALLIVKIFNSKMVQQLVKEIQQYFQIIQNQNYLIQKEFDVRLLLVMIYSNINIYKGLQLLLDMYSRKLLSISIQLQDIFSKQELNQIELKQYNQPDIDEQTIKLIVNMKENFQILFNKYQNIEFTKSQSLEFKNISIQISKEIKETQNKSWDEQIKVQHILFLSEIQTKLELIGLVQQDKSIIQQEIMQLFDSRLQEMQSHKKIDENNQQAKEMKQSQSEDSINLKLFGLFNCERFNKIIENLIIKSKKLKRIFKQNMQDYISKDQQINQIFLNRLKDTYTQSLHSVIIDLQQQTSQFCQQFNSYQQILFDEEFMKKLQDQPKIDQISALIQIFNFNPLLSQDKELNNQGENDDLIQNMIQELIKDTQINYEKGIFDMLQNSSYKIRELVVFNLIKMQSLIQEQTIQEFCENLLKQIWIIEKHPSVRNLLKNEEMIMMQKKLFSKDLQNFSIRLKEEMQGRLKQIEQLETQVLLSGNQDEMKMQLYQAYDNFEIYLDNITDMSQRLDISLIFLREISKDLKNIKSSIDQVFQSIKGVEDDIRRLRGKNFLELLQIRKQKVLKQKSENELDQIHIQFTTQGYDPISGSKKKNSFGQLTTYLITNQHDNYNGEVNEFLWSDQEKQKDVMIIKGRAGSGKSRASRNIEEFVWICDTISPNWIPIYVSLPQLKDPKFNLIDQALESENYHFDKIQIREFKEAIINGNLKILIILESYDEMEFQCIGTNLYHTNRLAQELNIQSSGQAVKLIITTREEILNSIGYQTWFYGQSIDTLKEIEILPLSQEQSQQYIKIYQEVSVKRTIKRFYEFLKQLKGQNFSLEEFKQIWSQLERVINSIISQQLNSDVLFSDQDIERLISKIQTIEIFRYIQSNQMISLKKDLLQLWGQQKFSQVINNLNINHLLNTPFMMELLVYVLPKMQQVFSQPNLIRDILKENFIILKKEAKKSQTAIDEYEKKQIHREDLEIQDSKNIEIFDQKIYLESIEQFNTIMEDLDKQNFFKSFSMANSLEYINSNTFFSNKLYSVKFDANFIVSAFKLNQFTAFDFYEQFVNFYHSQQLQKLQDLGKSVKQDDFLLNLQDFSIYLAVDMTSRQITQLNYKQKRKFFIKQEEKDSIVENSWDDIYFSENQKDFEYITLLRKCILINSKGSIYAFNHKSIQDFFVAKHILKQIEKIINNSDKDKFNGFLNNNFNKNEFNLSKEHYAGTLELLKPKLKQISNIKQKLIKIIQSLELINRDKFIRLVSNSLYILSSLGENCENLDLGFIQISDTKLNGMSFYKCNLDQSMFDNIQIDSCNFNCASIKKAQWSNLICKEKPTSKRHQSKIVQIVFINDGNSMISGSEDGYIYIQQEYSQYALQNIFKQNDKLLTFTISNSSNLLACLLQNKIVFLNSNTLSELGYQQLINYDYKDIILSQDGKYLAVQSISGEIYFWLIENLKNQTNQQKHNSQKQTQGSVLSIVISPNCQLIATSGTQITIWNSQNISNIQQIIQIPTQQKQIDTITFSPNTQILVAGGDNKKLDFWNIENINQIQLQYSIDSQQIIEQVSYSQDGRLFAARSKSQIKLYQVENLLDQQDFFIVNSKFKVDLVEISYDCKLLACSQKKNPQEGNPKITIWQINNLNQIKTLTIFGEHTEDILCLRFRNDNLVLGSGSLDKSICLWDLLKQKLIVKLQVHNNRVLDLTFSSDGKQMVSCSLDKTIIFWDIADAEQPQNSNSLQQNTEVNKIAFWPNKQIVVSFKSQTSKEINFWNSTEFKLISSQKVEENLIDINFNQEDDIMVSLSEKGLLQIWKINQESFEVQKKIQLKDLQSLKKIYYLNSKSIIVQSHVSVFQLNLSEDEQIKKYGFHFLNNAYCMSVASNQQFIVIGGAFGFELIHIENHKSSNLLYMQDNNICKDFKFSRDSSDLAVATEKGAFIYNIKSGQKLYNFEEKKCCLSICYIGQEQLAIGIDELGGQLVLYDIKDLQAIQQLKIIQLPKFPQKIQFLEKQQQICIYSSSIITLLKLSEQDSLQLIQIDKGKTSKDIIFDNDQLLVGLGIENQIFFYSLSDTVIMNRIFQPKQSRVYLHKNFSQNSNIFSVISDDRMFAQFNINLNILIRQVNLNISQISFLTLNYQETQFIVIQKETKSGKQRQKSSLIDLETNQLISCYEEIDDEKFKCEKVIFTQDGINFVSCYSDLTIKLWDAKACKLLSKFKSDTTVIELIAISTKGILAQTSQQVIKFWDLNALKQQQVDKDGHSDAVKYLCISPDGLQLVSGSESEIIRWDLTELKKIDILLKGKQLPSTFCFSHNCQYFAAFDDEQSIHIWKLNTKYIIEHHCKLQFVFDQDLAFNFDLTQLICKQNKSKILKLNIEQVTKQKQLLLQTNFSIQSRSYIFSANYLVKTNPFELKNTNNTSEIKKYDFEGIQISKITTIVICAISQRLAIEDQDSSIILWDIENKQKLSILQQSTSNNTQVLSMTFSHNGKMLFTCHNDEKIKLWNTSDKYGFIRYYNLQFSNNSNSTRKIYSLQIFPMREEDYIIIWSEEYLFWDTQISQLAYLQQDKVKQLEEVETNKGLFVDFSIGYCEVKNLIAMQFKIGLSIYDISNNEKIVTLEGNSLEKQIFSSILIFSEDGKTLLSLGRNHTIRFWDLSDLNSIKLRVNLKKQIQAFAFQFLNSIKIRIFSKSGEIIDEDVSEYAEICVIENGLKFDQNNVQEQQRVSEFETVISSRTLEISEVQNNKLKYILDSFTSNIQYLLFSPSGNELMLGMEDGSILLYKIDMQTLKQYQKPVCYYIFAKNPFLQAFGCKIGNSKFETIQNEPFSNLLIEKGALCQSI